MLSPASSIVDLSTELPDPGPHPCAGLDDREDEAGEAAYFKWVERQKFRGQVTTPPIQDDPQHAESRMSLRTTLRPPSRYREDEELTLDVMKNQASRVAAAAASATDRPALPALNTNLPAARGRPRKRSAPLASQARSLPSRRQLSPQSFPSLEPGILPPSKEEKRRAALEAWAMEDDSWGRWGETWDEVGPYADEREVGRAVEARAKRACYWDGKTTSRWYRDEMLEQHRRPQGQMHLTRRANVIHVLRTSWRRLADEVFGDDPETLEEEMMQVYKNFWQ
ncbi:hypothetical protein KVT40_005731 [Elsinoe batatas]|uniref:Uncharacterized protein n=1 Tax=Elsinoe batatas TaxID=2601811 RepID=A0A8K0KZ17_9PEZI|nr:hypothetical protein KVT40_005731 [Elsinoe batatas]